MKVFLDMDGVLVDFRRGVGEVFGRNDLSNSWAFWENWEGVTTKEISDICDKHFWWSLNWTPEGMGIYQTTIRKFLVKDIYLLTAPMPNLDSYTGKALWVNKHMPIYKNRLIVTPAPKFLLAGPNTLLIDDKDENVEEFRAAGGQAILVPRLWNKMHENADQTLNVVKTALEDF